MTQRLSCIDTPISWFLLDKCVSGELEAVEKERIERHLESCYACRASWDEVQTTTRELRPLVVPERLSLGERLRRWWWPAALVPALVTLVIFVLVGRSTTSEPGTTEGQHGGFAKGDTLAFSLLREHQGDTATDPTVYISGDRFRMLVSCAPPQSPAWDVVVYQDGEAFFPFAEDQNISCGNEIAIPGAFRVTGPSPVTVCLLMGEPLPTRDWLATSSPEDLSDSMVCEVILPVSP